MDDSGRPRSTGGGRRPHDVVTVDCTLRGSASGDLHGPVEPGASRHRSSTATPHRSPPGENWRRSHGTKPGARWRIDPANPSCRCDLVAAGNPRRLPGQCKPAHRPRSRPEARQLSARSGSSSRAYLLGPAHRRTTGHHQGVQHDLEHHRSTTNPRLLVETNGNVVVLRQRRASAWTWPSPAAGKGALGRRMSDAHLVGGGGTERPVSGQRVHLIEPRARER